jgi:hypothetical protein
MEIQLAGAALFIGVFGFLAVGAWAGARASERKAQARYALLTKLSEQPTESAKLVVEFLRDDERKHAFRKAQEARRGGLLAGAVLIAVGVGLGLFLWAIEPVKPVWMIGVMIVLMGAVFLGFALFNKPHENGTRQP